MERVDNERDERRLYFGLYLRHLRQQAGLTPGQLVDALAITDCPVDELEAIERGTADPRDPERFLRAVSASLVLDVGAMRELAGYLAFQMIGVEYGSATADWISSWSS